MAEVTIYDGGFPDQPESEREQQHGPWDDDDSGDADDLAADSVAAWRGEGATAHPPMDEAYPGKDDKLEREGDGHGGPEDGKC